jgi:glycosyltransferase involved in cell wall biosynthesis
MGTPVNVPGDMRSFAVVKEDRDLLAISGLLDDTRYRARLGLSDKVDAAAHYLEHGWLQGLDPSDGFDGGFLGPYYEATGWRGPPILTWLELSVMSGRRPPMNREEAEGLANQVRISQFFDAEAYASRLGDKLDPAIHYVVIGELLGWRPSSKFDPIFYLETYEDIARSTISPLGHYITSGRQEGRRAVPSTSSLAFPPLPDRQRRTVVLIVHEASRTGAPILGWNIIRRLARSYNVVSVLMRGGVLEEHFTAASAATVGPIDWEEWLPPETARVADRLVAAYNPLYVIANSIETHWLIPALAKLGVPSVALVHEFAAYTRPLVKMKDVFDWATHIVFPANLVAQSSYKAFPALAERRGVHVMAQGRVELPGSAPEPAAGVNVDHDGNIGSRMRPNDGVDTFVILGLGSVHIRKGVDLFLGTAACVRRLAPDLNFRFVWIGENSDAAGGSNYSVYLTEQIVRSDLAETVMMLDAVENLDAAYASADMFFMSSRLDPQPNVGIDAVTRGIPTVCFDGACGTAEILSADPETRPLVVAHLDTHAAAEVICWLARDRAALVAMRTATARVGAAAYDMGAYVSRVDDWGRAAAAALSMEDLRTLADARIVDAELALPPGVLAPGALGVERHVLQQWAVVGASPGQVSNPQFRRPCAGFNPQAYARAHPEECGEGGANPLAHWLRAGRPRGRWARQVFSPLDAPPCPSAPLRVALHAHFHYVLNARDLAARLAGNNTCCDLLLSTDTDAKAAQLRSAFARHRGAVEIRVMPNRGRDIGPFLTGFASEIANGHYDVFGHVHGKQSLSVDASLGHLWREFLWENLIGGAYPMLDLAVAAFAAQADLGLIMAEDPHLVGWDGNRMMAETLAARMGMVGPLDDFFDFPLGTMFWARPGALAPLLSLDLAWEDYPLEPLAYDGTLLHALERLVPYAARHAGLDVAGIRAPQTTW